MKNDSGTVSGYQPESMSYSSGQINYNSSSASNAMCCLTNMQELEDIPNFGKLGDHVISDRYIIVNNFEWGATLCLSHSGVCTGGKCQDIGVNKSYVSGSNKMDTTTGNVYGVYDMSGASAEYVVGGVGLGTVMEEVRISKNETWYNGSYVNNYKDYTVRGGVDKGLFSTSDIGMFDVSTRGVLVSK